MKKICILFNHFQIQDGVARTAIGLANELAKNKNVSVTLRPIFKCNKKTMDYLSPDVILKPFFGFYFQGLAKIIDMIPDSLLYSILIREKYDYEIGFCMKLPIKIIAASKNKEAKHYAWMHGYDTGVTLEKCYKKMDKVICVSKCNAEKLYEDTKGSIVAEYCYNLVDDEKVRLMGEEPVEISRKEGITFVGIGRLEYGKGFLRLIECIGRLKNEGYKVNLWLIGDGQQRKELEKRIKELKLQEEVILLGEQKNPHAYTSKADLLVCSSYSEGYSTVCTEAVMLGIPVLTTCVSGGQEIIDDAKAGLLVGMDDEDLYDGMKKILDHPEYIEEWKKTLLITRECFSYKKRAEKMMKTLDVGDE